MNIFSFVFIFLILINQSYGWGIKGHRATAYVADKKLTKTTKEKLSKLLGHENLMDVSTWADEIRSSKKEKYKKYLPWHYASVPSGTRYEQLPVKSQGDILIAIKTIIKELKSVPFEKMLASKKRIKYFKIKLKLLVHFISDIHQPLHVGNGEDKGGNLCHVKYFGDYKSLHSVWDTLMIERMNYSYTELGDYLIRFHKTKFSTKSKQLDPRSWLDESASIRQEIYPLANGKKKRKYCASNFSELNELKKSKEFLKTVPSLSYDYDFKHSKVLKTRIYLGGVRLASILNQIFN